MLLHSFLSNQLLFLFSLLHFLFSFFSLSTAHPSQPSHLTLSLIHSCCWLSVIRLVQIKSLVLLTGQWLSCSEWCSHSDCQRCRTNQIHVMHSQDKMIDGWSCWGLIITNKCPDLWVSSHYVLMNGPHLRYRQACVTRSSMASETLAG